MGADRQMSGWTKEQTEKTDGQTDRPTDREPDKDRHIMREIHRQAQRKTQPASQTDRQTGRQTDRRKDRQTDDGLTEGNQQTERWKLRERDFERDAQRVCWNSKSIWWVSWPRRNAASYQPRNLNSSHVFDNFLLHRDEKAWEIEGRTGKRWTDAQKSNSHQLPYLESNV